MKKFKLFYVLFTIGLFFFPSCDEADDIDNDGKGTLVLTAQIQPSDIISRADLDLSDYTVILSGTESHTMDFPTDGIISDLAAGPYTVAVSNFPTGYQPAFDDPRYSGSKDVSVVAGKSSDVEITLSQANTGILFVRDDSMDETVNLIPRVQQGSKTLEFSGENRTATGYFAPGDVNVTLWDGDQQLTLGGEDVQELTFASDQLWIVTFSMGSDGNTGSPSLTASVELNGSDYSENWDISGPDVTITDYVYVELSRITAASCYAHTIPRQEVNFYLTYCCTEYWWRSYENASAEKQIEYIQDRVGAGSARLLRQEYNLVNQLGNQCGSDFVFLVVAFDNENQPLGEVQRYDFRTPELVDNPPPTFVEVSIVEITSSSVTVKYVMDENTICYFPNVSQAGDGYESDRSSKLWLMDMLYEFEVEDLTLTFEGLQPGTEYGAWAFGCGVNGEQSGSGAYHDFFFTTLE